MTQLTLDSEQIKQLILNELPTLMRQSPQIQELILNLARQNFVERQEVDTRFYELLGELKRDREEQSRKWDAQNRKWDEQSRRWDEQNRKWDEWRSEWKTYTQEQNRKWEDVKREFDRMHEAIMAIAQKHDRSIGALGSRWGIQAESAFRNALAGILEKSFGVQVLNINDYDDEGIVFGRPDQIELDVIIKNGILIICEIKSSIDKAGMYIFERKVRFYEKKHQREAHRMLVISPMVDAKAKKVAEQLGIEIFSDSIEVETL